MGKIKDTRSKIMKIIAKIEMLEAQSSQRILDFKIDLAYTLAIRDKTKRYYELTRLCDEIHGYYLRLYQSLTSAQKVKEKITKKNDLSKLSTYIKENQFVLDVIDEMTDSRNKTAHPDPYYVNKKLFDSHENIFSAIGKVKNQIVDEVEIDSLEIKRQKNSQNNNLEKQLSVVVKSTPCIRKNKKM